MQRFLRLYLPAVLLIGLYVLPFLGFFLLPMLLPMQVSTAIPWRWIAVLGLIALYGVWLRQATLEEWAAAAWPVRWLLVLVSLRLIGTVGLWMSLPPEEMPSPYVGVAYLFVFAQILLPLVAAVAIGRWPLAAGVCIGVFIALGLIRLEPNNPAYLEQAAEISAMAAEQAQYPQTYTDPDTGEEMLIEETVVHFVYRFPDLADYVLLGAMAVFCLGYWRMQKLVDEEVVSDQSDQPGQDGR